MITSINSFLFHVEKRCLLTVELFARAVAHRLVNLLPDFLDVPFIPVTTLSSVSN